MTKPMGAALRRVSVAALLLVAAWPIYSDYGGPPTWYFLASVLAMVGVGVVLGRWWALLLALLPWPLGIGIGLLIGRYRYVAEGGETVWLGTAVAGAVLIALGVLSRSIIGAMSVKR